MFLFLYRETKYQYSISLAEYPAMRAAGVRQDVQFSNFYKETTIWYDYKFCSANF